MLHYLQLPCAHWYEVVGSPQKELALTSTNQANKMLCRLYKKKTIVSNIKYINYLQMALTHT